MPKLTKDFTVPINILVRDDQTKEKLIAIAYYRGEGGSYAGPTRDALALYIQNFEGGLSPEERKRYESILENVMISRNPGG